MQKIIIHGFYGQGNLGDEAILKAILQQLRRFPQIEPFVFSPNSRKVREVHGVEGISVQGKRHLLAAIWKLMNVDLYVLGGGGLLKDFGEDLSSLGKWLNLLRWAKWMNKKTALYAVGVEYLLYEQSKKMIRNILNSVDIITVRDTYSKNLLIDAGVTNQITVTTDPAVLLGNVNHQKTLHTSPKVIISVRHWFNKGFFVEKPEMNQKFIQCLRQVINVLIEKYNAQIEFIPMRTTDYDDDRQIAEEIAKGIKHQEKIHLHQQVPTIERYIETARKSTLILGMRLHSLILGTAVGTPVIGFAYAPKVRAYLESIDQAECCFDLETVTPEKVTICIENIFNHYNTHTEKIRNKISSLQEVAGTNMETIIQLIEP